MNNQTRKVTVTLYPYATQYGEIEVPVSVSKEDMQNYIKDHWDNIKKGEPELDYAGTDFDIET